jgi:hypothetical protein
MCFPTCLNIGGRNEDDVRVMENGCQNLSKALPREIADIEALMAEDPYTIQLK